MARPRARRLPCKERRLGGGAVAFRERRIGLVAPLQSQQHSSIEVRQPIGQAPWHIPKRPVNPSHKGAMPGRPKRHVIPLNDYRDLAAQSAIGAQKQGLAQQELDDAVRRHNYYADLPQNKLNDYMKTISGSFGGTTSTNTPYYSPSLFSQVAGGILGGVGALKSAGYNPFGSLFGSSGSSIGNMGYNP